MARPRLGDSESKRLQMVITETELDAIEDWRFRNRVPSKSEAIRRLCQIALRFDEVADDLQEQVNAFMNRLVEAAKEIEGGLSQDPKRYDYAAVHGAAYVGEMLEEQAKFAEKVNALHLQVRSLKAPTDMASAMGTADEIHDALGERLKEMSAASQDAWEDLK